MLTGKYKTEKLDSGHEETNYHKKFLPIQGSSGRSDAATSVSSTCSMHASCREMSQEGRGKHNQYFADKAKFRRIAMVPYVCIACVTQDLRLLASPKQTKRRSRQAPPHHPKQLNCRRSELLHQKKQANISISPSPLVLETFSF